MITNKIASNDIQFIWREIYAHLIKTKVLGILNKQEQSREISDIISYIKRFRVTVFPYEYINEYNQKDVAVKKDTDNQLLYIEDRGQKIYMRRGYRSLYRARRYYNNIRIEQDVRSPHRYTTEEFAPMQDTVILDIGGAEGFFGLEYIDIVKEDIYIRM